MKLYTVQIALALCLISFFWGGCFTAEERSTSAQPPSDAVPSLQSLAFKALDKNPDIVEKNIVDMFHCGVPVEDLALLVKAQGVNEAFETWEKLISDGLFSEDYLGHYQEVFLACYPNVDFKASVLQKRSVGFDQLYPFPVNKLTVDIKMSPKEILRIFQSPAENISISGSETKNAPSLTFEDVDDSILVAIEKALATSTHLLFLELSGPLLPNNIIEALMRGLKENKTLQYFAVYDFPLTVEAAKTLSLSLKENRALDEISLEGCSLGPDHAAALIEGLSCNKSLQLLWLDHNVLGSKGVAFLAEALEKNESLKELSLEDNCIDVTGLPAIARLIRSNKSLSRLTFRHNSLGEDATAIVEALESNFTLQRFYAGAKQFNETSRRLLSQLLTRNRALSS